MSGKGDSCKIWVRFESKLKNGSVVKLKIQDLPFDRKDDAVEFLVNNFMREEAFLVAAGIYKSGEAIQEYRELMKNMLKKPNMSLVMCCVDDRNAVGQIIGLSFMDLEKNTEKLKDIVQHMEFKTEELKNLFHILIVLEDHIGQLAFEIYYGGRGIAVHPDFRGLGLATEFVRVRKLVCIDHKVPMTCAWMTALGSQKAAEKNNWKTFFEISLEELEKKTGLGFVKKLPSFKLMYTTIN